MFAALMLAAALAASPTPPASDAPPEDPQAALAELEQVYQQSCANRAYGSYNDMCAEMRSRISAYRRDLAAAARRRPDSTASPARLTAPAPR